jgi:hypothetical protein
MKLVAVVTSAAAAAGLVATAATAEDSKSVRLSFYGLNARLEVVVDRPPVGGDQGTKGDVLRLTLGLTNSRRQLGRGSGATVGKAVQTYTLLSRRKASVTQVATLPGGTIHSSGVVEGQAFKPTLRVTGGSGSFAHARGTVELTEFPNGSQGQAYRLELP